MAVGRITVAVVGDDALARAGIHALLAADERIEVSWQAAEEDVPAAHARRSPAVLVWDVGSEHARSVNRMRAVAGTPVLVLTSEEDLQLAPPVRGIVTRDADQERIRAAVHAVAAGLVVVDENLAEALFPPRAARAMETDLTARELEVLELVARGLSNKEIGARLGISDHTAKFHVNAILSKLGVQSRTEAVVHAVRRGLVML